MAQPSPARNETVYTLGMLCVGGDWACAHGDMAGLRQVVRDLATCLPEPMHCELEELIACCGSDPENAPAKWVRLRDRVYRDRKR